MALSALLPMLGGAGAQGLGILAGFKNQRRTNRAYGIPDNFGKTPDVAPDSYTPLTQNLPDETAGQVQNTLAQGAASIPGFSLSTAQQTANQAALDAQKPYANEAIDLARSSSAGQADQYVKNQLAGGPEAISQLTFDRMAAQLSENAAAAARSRNQAAESWAARTGASPEAVLQVNAENRQSGDNALAGNLRDLLVSREQLNKQYGLDLARLAPAVSAGYIAPLSEALYARGGLEQPVNFDALGNTMLNYFLNSVNARNAATTATANNFTGLGAGLLNLGASNYGAQQAAAAAPSTWDSIAPALVGAGINQAGAYDRWLAG